MSRYTFYTENDAFKQGDTVTMICGTNADKVILEAEREVVSFVDKPTIPTFSEMFEAVGTEFIALRAQVNTLVIQCQNLQEELDVIKQEGVNTDDIADKVLDALGDEIDEKVRKAMDNMDMDEVATKVLENLDLDDAIETGITEYDFDQKFSECISNYDFDSIVDDRISNYDFDSIVENGIDNYDIDSKVNDIVNNLTFEVSVS